MIPSHELPTRVALAAAARYDFALAGCHALRAHGLGDRPCVDIELLTPRISGVTAATPMIVSALRRVGCEVTIELSGGSFARLRVRQPGGETVKVKLCVDHRTAPPTHLPIGPVLCADDAVGGAVVALLGRHLAEDFVDVDLILRSGRYARSDLLRLGCLHDPGFTAAHFCEALGAVRFIPDLAFAPYDLTCADVRALRTRYADWQRRLIAGWLSRGPG
jgi:hypothetical protein